MLYCAPPSVLLAKTNCQLSHPVPHPFRWGLRRRGFVAQLVEQEPRLPWHHTSVQPDVAGAAWYPWATTLLETDADHHLSGSAGGSSSLQTVWQHPPPPKPWLTSAALWRCTVQKHSTAGERQRGASSPLEQNVSKHGYYCCLFVSHHQEKPNWLTHVWRNLIRYKLGFWPHFECNWVVQMHPSQFSLHAELQFLEGLKEWGRSLKLYSWHS